MQRNEGPIPIKRDEASKRGRDGCWTAKDGKRASVNCTKPQRDTVGVSTLIFLTLGEFLFPLTIFYS